MSAYIIQRSGNGVYIREVDPNSCAFTLNKRDGWDFAQRLAKGARLARPAIPPAEHITFIDINGNRRKVA